MSSSSVTFVRVRRCLLAITCTLVLFRCFALAAAEYRSDWPTYGFDDANTRHVALRQIDRSNVSRLRPVWQYVLGAHEHVETTPIVDGGTMYVTTGNGNNVIALDASTGREKWRYRPAIGPMAACCGLINRGVAVSGNRVFVATLDARLIALDASSGKHLWDVRLGNPGYGFSETMAPLVWDGLVFIGSSGSDYGLRGSISAYRAANGRHVWTWYSVSRGWEGKYVGRVHGVSLHRDIAREKREQRTFRDAWAHGGGAIWMTPALDRARATLYLITSNPWPVFHGSSRPGDNLFTDCIVALNARTGKMVWYYQQTPHDVWEYEPSSPPMLFDALRGGKRVPAVGQAGKTQWFYVLDRRNGRLVRISRSLVPNSDAYDDPPNAEPDRELPLRGSLGPSSYDPRRHLAFVATIDHRVKLQSGSNGWAELVAAVNVDTGKVAWRTRIGDAHGGIRGDDLVAGTLSTPELTFVSDGYGRFYALDAGTGAIAWQHALGVSDRTDVGQPVFVRLAHDIRDWLQPAKRSAFREEPPVQRPARVDANPIAYAVGGTEYITIGYDDRPERAKGGALLQTFALR